MVELFNIGIKRDDWVLRNVNLSIVQGELIGIIGESGIGKTTLLKLMSGLVDASEGEVRFQGMKLIQSLIGAFLRQNLTMAHWIRLSLLCVCFFLKNIPDDATNFKN